MSALTKKLIKSAMPELFVGKDVLINGERVKLTSVTFSDTRDNDGIKISACVYAHVANESNDDVETFEAEQELKECDAVIAEQEIDIYEDFNEKPLTAEQLVLVEKEVDAFEEQQQTVSYIAKPQDTRCAWWSMIIPQDQQLDGNRLNAPYLRAGADLELKAGDMLIDSEANHHRKNRGYTVVLGVCDGEKVIFIKPLAEIKRYIKLNGGQDLMHETGDVNACIRIAVWLRRQSDLKYAVQTLLNQ